MNLVRKSYLTLIELLISLGLTVIVVSSLSYFLYEVEKLGKEADKREKELFQLRYAGARLSDILPRALGPPHRYTSLFYFARSNEGGKYQEGSSSLLFTYDAGPQLDPDFAGIVLAKIFVDPEGVLTIARWPNWKRWSKFSPMPPIKREELLRGVKSLRFEFYVPPEKDRAATIKKLMIPKGKPKTDIPEVGTWVKEWKADYFQLPALVKMEIKMSDGTDRTYIFPMANSDMVVVLEN